MADSPGTVDNVKEIALADSPPNVPSTPATTVASPSPFLTGKNVSTSTGTSTNGTISCGYCTTKFIYGRKGRRGQRSNLQQHLKHKHPEMVPNYQREVYRCRYNCGRQSIYKGALKLHEEYYCEVRKRLSQQPEPLVSKDDRVQEKEHSEVEVSTDAHSPQAQKAV